MTLPRPKLAALVLAAGYSSRMGQFKPRLPLGDRNAVEHAIDGFLMAGIGEVIVVTGHRAHELTAVLKGQGVRCIFNPRYDSGMYSSVVAGLRALPPEADACFVLPTDIPLVRPSTIEMLAAAYRKTRAAIVYPVFRGRRGHPPLVSRSVFASIFAGDGAGGMRKILSRYEPAAQEVSVLDEGIHMDMDTPRDYARLNALAGHRDVLSRVECVALLAEREVPARVVRHSRAVAEAAERLAVSLIQHGAHLNLALIEAGSLLHDIAKGKPDHARAGASILEQLGYPKVARIVAAHTDLRFASEIVNEEVVNEKVVNKKVLDEAVIVYLADKLVQGETVVPLRQRFERSFARFPEDAAALAAVNRRWETAQSVARAAEQQCGMSLGEMVEGAGDSRAATISGSDRNTEATLLGTTESVCPECLERVEAQRVRENGSVYLEKTCPQHGRFKTIVWRGEPAYESWAVVGKRPSQPPVCASEIKRGCPFDCGLCPDHRQHTCCVLLEVTQRCNLACPYCFAAAPQVQTDPSLEAIEGWYRALLAAGGPFNIQLSGGEPTLRDDLPEIIALAYSLGFSFVQLNTNGLRLAEDAPYLHRLKQAGLDCVFLQFDGVTDEVYERIRGAALLQVKLEAIRRCREEELGVVLVPTLVPDVNTGQIGEIIRLAIEEMPVVRAVHFQPVSYFGRYPGTPSGQPSNQPSNNDRITLPEVMQQIERQTAGQLRGEIRASDFYPPSAENAYCSFQGKFVLQPNGEVKASPRRQEPACCSPVGQPVNRLVQLANNSPAVVDPSKRAQQFVAQQWAFPATKPPVRDSSAPMNVESLDAFLRDEKQNTLSISGMAFQDAWNLDLERLRECFIHVLSPDRRLVPLCAYNLTDAHGYALHRTSGKRSFAAEVTHA
jgi:uncharacterized radical SAM superfamily Fe-S cluster-containing enzyme/CTP:molybdopterin cytidylyltransferase MocA/HD superfamily phosphohydrolase YqeK